MIQKNTSPIQSVNSPASADALSSATVSRGDAKASWLDAALLGIVFVFMLWGIGSYGLYEPHEGHFAGVGREMVSRGDWITPHLNGAPYLNKPPLFYWLIASSYTIFGRINEWVARFPLALIGIGGVVLVWQWARELWGIRAGRIAGAMLAVSAGWYLFSHQLLIDLLLCVLYLANIYVLWKALLDRESAKRWAIFYIVVGLDIMAKGLIGLMFPLVVLGMYAAWRRDWKLFKEMRPGLGLGILALITGPWLVLIEIHNPGSLWYMIVNEHFKRVMDVRWPPDYSGVKVSAPIYLLITAVWLAPWSLLLPQIGRFLWKEIRSPLGGVSGPGISVDESERVALALMLLGTVVPVLTFLPMPSRLIYYGLPSLPFLVLLAARWWSKAVEDSRGRALAVASFVVLGGIVFSAGFWLRPILEGIPDVRSVPAALIEIPLLAIFAGSALVVGGGLLAARRSGWSMVAIVLLLGAGELYNVNGFADFDDSRSSKRLVETIRPLIGDECIWVSEGSKEIGASAGIAYYLGSDAQGKARSVYILEAKWDDSHRAPPTFPGPKAAYLLPPENFEEIWNSDKPVLFVTDFLRNDWLHDYPLLPAKNLNQLMLNHGGNRRVYANGAAWKKLENSGIGKLESVVKKDPASAEVGARP